MYVLVANSRTFISFHFRIDRFIRKWFIKNMADNIIGNLLKEVMAFPSQKQSFGYLYRFWILWRMFFTSLTGKGGRKFYTMLIWHSIHSACFEPTKSTTNMYYSIYVQSNVFLLYTIVDCGFNGLNFIFSRLELVSAHIVNWVKLNNKYK